MTKLRDIYDKRNCKYNSFYKKGVKTEGYQNYPKRREEELKEMPHGRVMIWSE